jgi:hypothetical protein
MSDRDPNEEVGILLLSKSSSTLYKKWVSSSGLPLQLSELQLDTSRLIWLLPPMSFSDLQYTCGCSLIIWFSCTLIVLCTSTALISILAKTLALLNRYVSFRLWGQSCKMMGAIDVRHWYQSNWNVLACLSNLFLLLQGLLSKVLRMGAHSQVQKRPSMLWHQGGFFFATPYLPHCQIKCKVEDKF